ncbi:hypothetical protein SORBI_3009G128000 [Sorghum bicolor]|uniref:Uncharacterized protein n=1 Tax=Sorghum bicolor TaxID=4558 RepID=A0A1B6P8F0_SORBI|nr:hypothetical protein SORBI_3009G128000 [Sorghum bicolor]
MLAVVAWHGHGRLRRQFVLLRPSDGGGGGGGRNSTGKEVHEEVRGQGGDGDGFLSLVNSSSGGYGAPPPHQISVTRQPPASAPAPAALAPAASPVTVRLGGGLKTRMDSLLWHWRCFHFTNERLLHI